jgi:hypothetical protein
MERTLEFFNDRTFDNIFWKLESFLMEIIELLDF